MISLVVITYHKYFSEYIYTGEYQSHGQHVYSEFDDLYYKTYSYYFSTQ
jgi:hypothetical protein